MRIAVANDHAGFLIKDEIINLLQQLGHEVVDLGTYDQEPVDYPDYAEKVGRAILAGQVDRGIVICGSGVGACIASNKIHRIYASVCHDTYSAHQGVEHDNMNVLCLGAKIIGQDLAREIVTAFVNAKYSNEDRHNRRIGKILKLEQNGKINNSL
jgi:RpiB/LacA/LacB family sugar-phosphate isomerase